jgi:dimethylamine monooxygenase subunit A
VGWLDELRLDPMGPPWLTMGTSRTDRCFTPPRDRAFKQRLLDERRDEVLVGLGDLDAIERLALLVDEDLCYLAPDGHGRFLLVAGCVCSPSHWRLTDKLGQSVAAIHGGVAHYNDDLARRVEGFLERLRPGAVIGRRNWTVHETSERFEPDTPPSVGVPPEQQWLRSERQTLQCLPRSGGLQFTIRTDMVQLRDVPFEHRRRLAERLAAEPVDLIAYRDLTDRRADLIAYLER